MFATAASLLAPESLSDAIPDDYEGWLRYFFPTHVIAGFAEHHRRWWRWVWALQVDVRPDVVPVLIWPRGGAKSTSVELGCAAAGARATRRYVLYVSGKQQQADDHVGNVASLLESPKIGIAYPELGERKVNKFGSSLGWRRNRIRTASGFTVDALGLDVVARGVKLDEQRPDWIVFDDVDDTADSMETVEKKITAITQKILPSEAATAAASFVQNLVHYESVAARLAGLASQQADFLADREVSGPYPAILGLKTEPIPGTFKHRIVAGTPIWDGQDLATAERQIDRWGITAFRAEAQHERMPPTGQAFPEFDPSVHVVESVEIGKDWPRYRAVDYGYAAPYCCLWGARRPDGGLVIYREDYGSGMTAPEQAKRVANLSQGETYKASVGDPSMWAKNREGKRYRSIHEQYRDNGVKLTKASNERVAGWSLLHALLSFDDDRPPLLQISRACVNLIRTLPMMVQDSTKPEDIDSDLEDHALDASRYLAQAAVGRLLRGAIARAMQATPDATETYDPLLGRSEIPPAKRGTVRAWPKVKQDRLPAKPAEVLPPVYKNGTGHGVALGEPL